MKASERIATLVHAFWSPGHRDEVRRLAEHVRLLEEVATKARAAMGRVYRAGADDELRAALAALDEKGGTDAQG